MIPLEHILQKVHLHWYLPIPNFLSVFRMLGTVFLMSLGVIKLTALSDIKSTVPPSSLSPFFLALSKFTSTHRQTDPANTTTDSAWFTCPDCGSLPVSQTLPHQLVQLDVHWWIYLLWTPHSQVHCSTWTSCWPTTLVQTSGSLTCLGVQLQVREEALWTQAHREACTQLVWVRDKHLSALSSWQHAHRLCCPALAAHTETLTQLTQRSPPCSRIWEYTHTLFQPLQLEVKDPSSFLLLLLRPHLLQQLTPQARGVYTPGLSPVPDPQPTQGHLGVHAGHTYTWDRDLDHAMRAEKRISEIVGQADDQAQTSEAGLFNTLFYSPSQIPFTCTLIHQ